MLTLQVTLIKISPYAYENLLNKILEKLNVHPKKYLNGSLMTQLIQIQTNTIFS